VPVRFNDPITFGRNGTAKELNCTGIDFSEDGNRSWTTAQFAELEIQLPFVRQEIFLQLEAAPFLVPDAVSSQRVFIFLGGMFVGYWSLTGHDVRKFPLNRNSAASLREARLGLVIPTATSPESLRMSADMRELGLYLTSIVFGTVEWP
jgi:hypothetical protein